MNAHSVVMIGATGAVGGVVVKTLAALPQLQRLTLLGRRPVEGISGAAIAQELVDVFDPASYARHLPGHATAICTLGVGQRAGMSQDAFVRIDKTAVLDFATACRKASRNSGWSSAMTRWVLAAAVIYFLRKALRQAGDRFL